MEPSYPKVEATYQTDESKGADDEGLDVSTLHLRSHSGRQPGIGWVRPLAFSALGLGLGALAMYLFDPSLGRARRARIADRARSRVRRGTFGAQGKLLHYWKKTVAPLQATIAHLGDDAPEPDERLAARVHTLLGRVISHPSHVFIRAERGSVRVEGMVPRAELDALIESVRNTRGVRDVDCRVQVVDA